MWVPFIVYANFESFTPQVLICQPNPEKSYTKQYQKHIPSGFCYHIKCFDATLYSQPVACVKDFNDDDVAQIFIDTLEKNIKEIYKNLGLAWDATLKITKVQLELLSDPDMLLMIESRIRGGIAKIWHRHAKANNEYMRTEFDLVKKSIFISIYMLITFMVGQYQNNFQRLGLNGWPTMNLMIGNIWVVSLKLI